MESFHQLQGQYLSFLEEFYQAMARANPTIRREFDEEDLHQDQTLARLLSLSQIRSIFRAIVRNKSNSESSDYEKELQLFKTILRLANEEVSSWGGKIVFVYLPQGERYLPLSKPQSFLSSHRLEILAEVNNLSIDLIDIHLRFEKLPDPLKLYYYVPGSHYSESGHQVVSKAVIEYLEKHND